MSTKKLNFEDYVAKLEESSELLRSGKLSLEENLKLYQDSLKYYEQANKILADAKQKIEIYRPETAETEDFENI